MPTSVPITLTVSDDAMLSAQAYVVGNVSGQTTTLVDAINASATTITLADPALAINGRGLVINDEAVLVTAGNAGTGVCTVTRARLNTTAAVHAAGAPVAVQRVATLMKLLNLIIQEAMARYMDQYPPPTVSVERTKIATANALIEAAKAVSIT